MNYFVAIVCELKSFIYYVWFAFDTLKKKKQ